MIPYGKLRQYWHSFFITGQVKSFLTCPVIFCPIYIFHEKGLTNKNRAAMIAIRKMYTHTIGVED
jgi:hypothetical protein